MRGLLFLLFVSVSVGVEFQEEKIMENLKRLKKEGLLSEEQIKRIEEFKRELKGVREKALERAKEWKVEKRNGKVVVERRREKEKKKSLPTVYIFMSSSVPLEIWWRYAHYLVDKKIPGVFVLRGCIGGCRYIRPTVEFIYRFLTEDGKNEEGLPVEVQIDPIKFREWGVKVVPCVAVEGGEKLSCGDWSLEYHLEVLGYGEGGRGIQGF